MTTLNNLGAHADGELIAQSQSQKEVTSNALDNLLSNATQRRLAVAIADAGGPPPVADRTLGNDEFFGNHVFSLTGTPTVVFGLILPATGSHVFAVRNQTGQTATVRVGAGASVAIAAGQTRVLHSDGADVIALAAATS